MLTGVLWRIGAGISRVGILAEMGFSRQTKAMDFLHYEFDLGTDDCVEVTLDKQANVRLVDGSNFASYKAGREHRFYGGLARKTPITLQAPRPGRWHLVIDLGSHSGTVNATAKIVKGQL